MRALSNSPEAEESENIIYTKDTILSIIIIPQYGPVFNNTTITTSKLHHVRNASTIKD